MRDTELYRQILGIESPWEVDEVELDRAGGEVRVHLSYSEPRPECPQCGQQTSRYDSRPRRWRHLDTCVGRAGIAVHGAVRGAGDRLAARGEHRRGGGAVRAVVGGGGWDHDGAVRRGLARRWPQMPTRLGVAETSFKWRHEYVTVVIDQEAGGGVLHVADGRGREGVDEFFDGFTPEQLVSVESIQQWFKENRGRLCFGPATRTVRVLKQPAR